MPEMDDPPIHPRSIHHPSQSSSRINNVVDAVVVDAGVDAGVDAVADSMLDVRILDEVSS